MAYRRRESGQATTDYVALLAVVVALVAIAATLVGVGAPGVVNAVRGQMAQALCIVTGHACPVEQPRPCAVAMRRESRSYGINVALLRADRDHFVLREQLSDGTVRLTVVTRYGAGVEGAVGFDAQVDQDPNSGEGEIGREAKLGAEGVIGTGRIYLARNPREADAIMRAIDRGEQTPVPPREVVYEGGMKGQASVKLGSSVAGLDLNARTMRLLALRRNLQTGESTFVLTLANGGSALASSVVGGPTGSLDTIVMLAVKLDRRHNPVELSLLATGTIAAGAKLSKALAAPLALSDSDSIPANAVGRRWEFAARVDPTDPEVAAAWKRFRGSPASMAAIRGLAQSLRDRATLDVRSYRARSSSNGTSLGIALGVKLGFDTERTIDRFNLLAASIRPPGGLWEPRLDCVR